ncbi:unnamed protein product [Camellia sinensis]
MRKQRRSWRSLYLSAKVRSDLSAKMKRDVSMLRKRGTTKVEQVFDLGFVWMGGVIVVENGGGGCGFDWVNDDGVSVKRNE